MAKFTDLQVKAWIKSNTRFDAKGDGGSLYLRYRETDKSPVWFFRYKLAGIEQKLILGHYPDMGIGAARKEALILKAEVLNGSNPAHDRRESKRQSAAKAIADKSAQTVAQLVDEYFKRNVEGIVKTAKAKRQRIDNHLIPAIGRLRIEDVKPLHISEMLHKIADGGAPTTANDVLTEAKAMFNYAIKRHIITSNPAAAFDRFDAGGKEKPRDRWLTGEELTILLAAMRDSGNEYQYKAVKLLILLGCRKEELSRAKRTDFDLVNAVWHMPAENKTGRAIDIPLTPAALEIVDYFMAVSLDDSQYLFPTRSGKSKAGHVGSDFFNDAIKAANAGIDPFQVRDLRATMRTHLAKLGVDRFVAERCLNHTIPGVEGIYDRGDYFTERRTALELWSAFIQSCEDGRELNVVPFRQKTA